MAASMPALIFDPHVGGGIDTVSSVASGATGGASSIVSSVDGAAGAASDTALWRELLATVGAAALSAPDTESGTRCSAAVSNASTGYRCVTSCRSASSSSLD